MLIFLSAGGEPAMSADECRFLTLASRLPSLEERRDRAAFLGDPPCSSCVRHTDSAHSREWDAQFLAAFSVGTLHNASCNTPTARL